MSVISSSNFVLIAGTIESLFVVGSAIWDKLREDQAWKYRYTKRKWVAIYV